MYRRFNQQQERRKKGEFRSKLEEQISASLQQQGHEISYERDRFDYYLKRFYTPDFIVKGQAFEFYIEVKGYWDSAGRSKFLAVIQRHPTLPIFIAFQKPHQTYSESILNKSQILRKIFNFRPLHEILEWNINLTFIDNFL